MLSLCPVSNNHMPQAIPHSQSTCIKVVEEKSTGPPFDSSSDDFLDEVVHLTILQSSLSQHTVLLTSLMPWEVSLPLRYCMSWLSWLLLSLWHRKGMCLEGHGDVCPCCFGCCHCYASQCIPYASTTSFSETPSCPVNVSSFSPTLEPFERGHHFVPGVKETWALLSYTQPARHMIQSAMALSLISLLSMMTFMRLEALK